jgi:zinc transport system substrate-binding protein
MKRAIFIFLFLIICFFLGARGGEDKVEKSSGIYVSILPQAYLLERIVGDLINVNVMVTPGKSPATYEPTPQQVVDLGSASLFFTIGVPFEKSFLPSIESTLTDLPFIDSSAGIERRQLDSHHHEEGDEDEKDHESGTDDPHIWLSPVLAKKISQNMAEEVIEKYPAYEETFRTNLQTLLSDLDDLDKELLAILKPVEGETLFVYHPSFGYFADRYGLKQEAIELGGKEPSPADLEKIIQEAKNDGVRIILVQPEFSQSSARAVAKAINGSVIPVETLSGDYINNLKDLASQIKKGLE